MGTDRQAQAVELQRQGFTRAEIGDRLGISLEGVKSLLRRARAELDPAIQDSMTAVGTNMVPALAWAKTKSEDGTSYSVLLKPEAVGDDVLTRVREAFEGMAPAKPVVAPAYADDDLCTVYPIADRHNGMKAWGKETGEDYDSEIASKRLTDWMGRCIEASPASGLAVILDNGDGEHADDYTNATPKSKHTLDVDTRLFLTLETSVESLATSVDLALAKHAKVIVRILPGNHNPTTYLAVMFALAERYRNEPRVEVQKVPGEFWVERFGDCLLAAHHGDKAKPQQIVMFLADEYASTWGQTRHRFLWTGHLHHMKAQDIGGVQWEQLRAVTARDAYATSHAYVARAQLQAITVHRTRGEIQRVKVGV
jgi:hypothetical protein